MAIETNIIHSAHAGGDRLAFLGSSRIHRKFAPRPIKEESPPTGPPEPTNEWPAIAKIAGVELCRAYGGRHGRRHISVMPCNPYAPNDNFNARTAMRRRRGLANSTRRRSRGARRSWRGSPARIRWNFLYVDDLARGVVFRLNNRDEYEHINRGVGSEISIHGFAASVARATGFLGQIVVDAAKPGGAPRQPMDSSRTPALGWKPEIALDDGVADAYRWLLENSPMRRATARMSHERLNKRLCRQTPAISS